jgi:NADH-quinone oxidoreductase subunit E
VSQELTAEIRKLGQQFPDSRTAILPALRLVQEANGGWLTPESFEQVGSALGLTPAYCQAVASLYDMFHQAPVGRHSVEVCTNLSCALVGAQQVVDAFESSSASRPARRPKTARSRSARPSASAAAGTRPSSQSTTATTST